MLQELESIGEAPEEEFRPVSRSSGSGVSLFQAALCVLALITLVVLKAARPATYEEVANWYRQEAAREIALPSLSWERESAEASDPEATPEPSQAPREEFGEIGSLQEI